MSLVTAGPSNNQAHRATQIANQRMVCRKRGEPGIKIIGSKCRRDCRWIGVVLSSCINEKSDTSFKKVQSFMRLCKACMDRARLLIGKSGLNSAIQSVGSKCQTPRLAFRSGIQSRRMDCLCVLRSACGSIAFTQVLRTVDYYCPVRQRSWYTP